MEAVPAKAIAPCLPTGKIFRASLTVPSALLDAPSAANAKPSLALAIRSSPARPGKTAVGWVVSRAEANKNVKQAKRKICFGILRAIVSCLGKRIPFAPLGNFRRHDQPAVNRVKMKNPGPQGPRRILQKHPLLDVQSCVIQNE